MSTAHTTEFIIVMTTLPDAAAAGRVVRELVERRLVACGTVIGPVRSIYRWKGNIEESVEVQVLLKTRGSRFAALEAAVQQLHPYEVPELIALPVDAGLASYLDWVSNETAVEDAA